MNRTLIISLLVPAIMSAAEARAAGTPAGGDVYGTGNYQEDRIEGDYGRIARRNFWNASQNAAGLRADSLTISFAEIHAGAEHGPFRDCSGSSRQWSIGAEARTILHLQKVSMAGSFSFDRTTFYDMCGSMLVSPGYYPLDIMEFTPGRKDLQTYAFSGGFSADVAPRWRIGAGIDFTARNYVKRKDLRHTNYRLDMTVGAGAVYHSGDFAFGLNYIFCKNSETATAEEVGNSVANYYAFLDKGLMYGAYELWSGSGVHLSDTGVSGFPLSEMHHGAALQLSAGEFFLEAKYLYGSGKAGEKTSVWYRFPSHRVSLFAGYRFHADRGDHFLRLNFDWFRQYNDENVLGRETENGVSLTYVYGSNRIFERTIISLRPEYEWTGKRTEFRAGLEISSLSRLSSLMYPYLFGQDILSGRIYGSAAVKVGSFDLRLGFSYFAGKLSESEALAETDNVTAGDPPYHFTECYDIQNEWLTAPRTDLSLSVRWNLPLGLYVEAAAGWTHAYRLDFIAGADRLRETLKFGYVF